MAFVFTNKAFGVLTEVLDIGDTAALVSGYDTFAADAALTGGNLQRCILEDDTEYWELVDVSANPLTGTLTLVRARESTSQREWPAGSHLSQYLSQAVLESLQ